MNKQNRRLNLTEHKFSLFFLDNRISRIGRELQETPFSQQAGKRRDNARRRRLLTDKRLNS